jgi:rapamycin-insensitive companion of mTOR
MRLMGPGMFLTNYRRASLTDKGNIGSTDGGVQFLEEEEIIEAIVEVAEQSPVLSIRG